MRADARTKSSNQAHGGTTPHASKHRKTCFRHRSDPGRVLLASDSSAFSRRPQNTAGLKPTSSTGIPPCPVCRMQTPSSPFYENHDFLLRTSTAQASPTPASRKTTPLRCARSRAHPWLQSHLKHTHKSQTTKQGCFDTHFCALRPPNPRHTPGVFFPKVPTPIYQPERSQTPVGHGVINQALF